jgi:hypothetical protein
MVQRAGPRPEPASRSDGSPVWRSSSTSRAQRSAEARYFEGGLPIRDWPLLEIATAIFLGVWILLTLARQLCSRKSWIQMPVGEVIPDWRFFAPEPAVEDNVVVYRLKASTGEIGPLQTVTLPSAGALRCVWNPEDRRHKALWDLTDGVQGLAKELNGREPGSVVPDALTVTVPYLALLNTVSAELREAAPGLIQFGIIQSAWPDEEELVFLSRWHTLDTQPVKGTELRTDRQSKLSPETPRRTTERSGSNP